MKKLKTPQNEICQNFEEVKNPPPTFGGNRPIWTLRGGFKLYHPGSGRSLWYFLDILLQAHESQNRHIFRSIIPDTQIIQNAMFFVNILWLDWSHLGDLWVLLLNGKRMGDFQHQISGRQQHPFSLISFYRLYGTPKIWSRPA